VYPSLSLKLFALFAAWVADFLLGLLLDPAGAVSKFLRNVSRLSSN
jgi:hypothetical protein